MSPTSPGTGRHGHGLKMYPGLRLKHSEGHRGHMTTCNLTHESKKQNQNIYPWTRN